MSAESTHLNWDRSDHRYADTSHSVSPDFASRLVSSLPVPEPANDALKSIPEPQTVAVGNDREFAITPPDDTPVSGVRAVAYQGTEWRTEVSYQAPQEDSPPESAAEQSASKDYTEVSYGEAAVPHGPTETAFNSDGVVQATLTETVSRASASGVFDPEIAVDPVSLLSKLDQSLIELAVKYTQHVTADPVDIEDLIFGSEQQVA